MAASMSVHLRLECKSDAPGFGPYALSEGGTRNDKSVLTLCAAVFDVDVGTRPQVERCDELLGQANLARHWYTTHSHSDAKPSWRLVLPFATDVHPDVFPTLRRVLLARFAIPADPAKCSGRSHFYYYPSCRPDAEPVARTCSGSFLEPGVFVPMVVPREKPWLQNVTPRRTASKKNVDADSLRLLLRGRLRRYVTKGEHQKARLLQLMLDGQALAAPGDRHNAMRTLTSMLVWALPEVEVDDLFGLIEPSLRAMADPQWTEAEDDAWVYSLLHSALVKYEQQHAEADAAVEWFRQRKNELLKEGK